MPVLKKFRLVITLASLSGAILATGPLHAQIGLGLDSGLKSNKSLTLSEGNTLPVPPRQLPAWSDLNHGYPSTGADPYVERQLEGRALPADDAEDVLGPVAIKRVPSKNAESIRVAKAKQNFSPSPSQSQQELSLSLGQPSPDRLQAVIDDSSLVSDNLRGTAVVDKDFTVPKIPAVLQNLRRSKLVSSSGVVGSLAKQRDSQTELFTGENSIAPVEQPAIGSVGIVNEDKLLWWKQNILTATIPNSTLQSVETNGLVYFALQRSPRLRAVSQNPLIREQQIIEAEAAFDPVSFLQTQFQDRVDPVGDELSVTNDGTEFLDDHIWTADLGVRRKATSGATVELTQRLGFRNSNSDFFLPQDQGTATLALNVTQPLLRGRGKYYNQSQILIAQAATNASWDALAIELQNEIQSVVEAYWRLYFDRCVFLQKQMNVQRAESTLAKLEGRSGLDALPSQVARARSAVQSRRTELANARRDIRNSETDIRRLTADSNWQANQMIELLPVELPDLHLPVADLQQVIVTAINHRPEIREAIKRSKVAAIQRDISVNELLPELSLLMGTYVSALEGESRLGDAFVDQFGGVKPGYSVGLEFELPIRNRAARSRLTQRKLQMNLIKAEIDETMQNVIAESQIARRRVVSAKETLVAAIEAIHAARLEMEQNDGRWEAFALVEGDIAEGQSPTVVLDRLLDSQERLAAAELVYAQAEMELKVAEVAMQRTMGTLMTHQSVDFGH